MGFINHTRYASRFLHEHKKYDKPKGSCLPLRLFVNAAHTCRTWGS